jgi:hypothetical protein
VLTTVAAVLSSAIIPTMVLPFGAAAPVPVPFALPCPPMVPHIAIGNVFVSDGSPSETWRYPDDRAWYSVYCDAAPRAIIPGAPVPVTTVRTIPITVIKENVYSHFRRIIDIVGPRNYDKWRRSRKDYGRQSYTNTDIHLCITFHR